MEKDNTIYTRIFDLYHDILNETNNFTLSSDFYLNKTVFNDDFNLNVKFKSNNDSKNNQMLNLKKNFNFFQNVFNSIIENLISLILGIKITSEKNTFNYVYTDDCSLLNFSNKFFLLIKSNFEKYSKFINTSHNYDLMENILNLYTDYAILFGFKYNVKKFKNLNTKQILVEKDNNQVEFLFNIIEILKNSHLSKYSDSIKYAFDNIIEI